MISALRPDVGPCKFDFTISGQNLEKINIVFLVKNIIKDFLKEFDFLLEKRESNVGRNKDYEVEELLGLVIFGALKGKNSCRELESWVKDNDEACAYIMNNKKPSKSTINRFKKGKELLIEVLFEYIVSQGLKLELIGGDHVSMDGTIFKAYASRYKLITIEELKYIEKLIKSFDNAQDHDIKYELRKYYVDSILDEFNTYIVENIESNLKKEAINLLSKSLLNNAEKKSVLKFIGYLKDNYDGKNTISVTDPECRWMRDKEDKMGLNYNYQTVIDDKFGFIVAQKLVNDPTDHQQFIPMANQTKMNLGKHPKFYTADNGFHTIEALYYIFYQNINAIIPDKDQSSKMKTKTPDKRFKKSNFKYDYVNDSYICPENKILEYKSIRRMNDELYRVYSTVECKTCDYLEKCANGRKREILATAHPLKKKMRENYNSDLGRKLYKKRFHTGESYFGTLKSSRNFRGIRRNTIKKAQMELTIQAIVHNIKIIYKHRCK